MVGHDEVDAYLAGRSMVRARRCTNSAPAGQEGDAGLIGRSLAPAVIRLADEPDLGDGVRRAGGSLVGDLRHPCELRARTADGTVFVF